MIWGVRLIVVSAAIAVGTTATIAPVLAQSQTQIVQNCQNLLKTKYAHVPPNGQQRFMDNCIRMGQERAAKGKK